MDFFRDHLLSIITYTPLLGAAMLMLPPFKRSDDAVRWVANLFGFAGFLVSLPLWFRFDRSAAGFQFIEKAPWIPTIGVSYYFGVDGISTLLVLLTTLLGAIAILSSWKAIHDRVRQYYVFLLLLQVGMLGVFCALDMFLFYVFWEVMLVPMYFLIGIWGSARRLYAAIKFFLYTLVGSVVMLLGILALYFQSRRIPGLETTGTFDVTRWFAMSVPADLQFWIFLAFFLGFAIKVPMFPFHTWLPDAHVEAPTAGSVILAGILLKLGTYGFFRFNLPMFPGASKDESSWHMSFGTFGVRSVVVFLAIVSIIYGALAAMYFVVKKDGDVKKLVAYSSVSSMGMVMLGLFALNPNGVNGGVLQMINHGIYSAALFLLVGIIYERRHTRNVAEFGGLSHVMPGYAAVFLAMAMTAIGLPLLCVFISEFLALRGAFEANPAWAAWGALGIILNAGYMLWLYQRMFFGNIDNPKNEKLTDLEIREWVYMTPLVIMSLWIGVYPKAFLDYVQRPVNAVVRQVRPAYPIPGIPPAVQTPQRAALTK